MVREPIRVELREFDTTGVFLAHANADYSTSIALLEQNHLRPLALQEALVKTDQSQRLKRYLKDNSFYLAETGTKLLGYYLFDDNGDLTRTSWFRKSDPEKTVYAWRGKEPLFLSVFNDEALTRVFGYRFYIGLAYPVCGYVTAVVGVRDENAAAPIKEIARK